MKVILDEKQLLAVVDLLMGAAYADGEFDGMEAGEISDILHELIGDLPATVSMRLAQFDSESFSLKKSCAPLISLELEARRKIMGLIAQVTASDGVHDFSESEYLRWVMEELGCDLTAFDDHTFDIEIVSPPPLPS